MRNYIENYQTKDIYPFHMPGHKRNSRFLSLGKEPVFFDMTEFDGMDNLHHPEGFIKDSMERCAHTFGADESFYLVNGATVGIMASVLACTNQNRKIIAARNSHKSVFSGILYAGAEPLYIYPEMTAYGIPGGIHPGKLKNLMKNSGKVTAVIITSPTYEGFTSDIAAIADVVHENGGVLIVDEAHGAHFGFHHRLPCSALAQGADIVVQSFHKTLPAFTQSSVLHVKKGRVDLELLKSHLSMLQSSSPSYLLMLGLDNCVHLLEDRILRNTLFSHYMALLNKYREKFSIYKNITLLGAELKGRYAIHEVDPGKLVVYFNRLWQESDDIDGLCRDKFQIQLEMCTESHLLAMTSIADREVGFERLVAALTYLEERFSHGPQRTMNVLPYPEAATCMPFDAALSAPKEQLKVRDAVGRISGDFVMPYPPGIPVIAPGEAITESLVKYLPEKYQDREIAVILERNPTHK